MEGFEIDGFTDPELIGRGGFAAVFKAYEPAVDRVVAIKVLDVSLESRTGSIEKELRALSQMAEHPNIAQVLGTGTDRQGRPYLVMPFYRNGSLDTMLFERGSLEIDPTLRMGVKLAGAIASLHKAGLTHGDIKPANILLSAFGDPVLADFGLSELIEHVHGDHHPEWAAFTPVYAAPEVLEGQRGAEADVYGLAAVLFQCINGEPPFQLTDPGDLRGLIASKFSPPALIGDVPPTLSSLIGSALRPSPGERPDAEEFGRSLQALQGELGLPVSELVLPAELSAASTPTRPPTPTTVVPVPVPPAEPVATPEPPPPAPTPYSPYGAPPYPPSPYATWPPSPPAQDAAPPPPAGPPPTPYLPPSAAGHLGYGPPPAAAAPARGRSALGTVGRALGTPFMLLAAGLTALARTTGRAVRRLWQVLTLLHGKRRSATAAGQPDDSISWVGADRPTAEDLLGYRSLVEGLARLLNDESTALPITIGIAGQWGSGKSSLMLQLSRYLRESHSESGRTWIAITFDAWRFQGRESVWAGLARAIYKQTQAQLTSPWRRLRFRLRLERLRRGNLRFTVGVGAWLAGAVFVVISAARVWTHAATWNTTAGIAAGLAAVTTASTYLGAIGAPFERALSRGSVTKKYDEFLGISDQAEHDIDHLLTAVGAEGPGKCLIVLMDDLDRCQTGVIGETLATITEVFGRRDQQKIAFVLGIDMDVVTSAVDGMLSGLQPSMSRLNPRRASEMSQQFLEKVFQLTLGVEGQRRLPIERLLLRGEHVAHDAVSSNGSSGPPPVSPYSEALSSLSVANPDQLTAARHSLGISTGVVPFEDLKLLRSAVRLKRASLLTVGSEDVLAAEEAVVSTLRMTPRGAKRFDNALRLQLQVANSTPGCELNYDRAELIAVAKWVCLRMFFPAVGRQLDQQPGLLGELEELAGDVAHLPALRNRIRELVPHFDRDAMTDLIRLLSLDLPASSCARLPLDTFATTV